MTDNRQDTCGWKTMLTRHKGDIKKKEKEKPQKLVAHLCHRHGPKQKKQKNPKSTVELMKSSNVLIGRRLKHQGVEVKSEDQRRLLNLRHVRTEDWAGTHDQGSLVLFKFCLWIKL